MNKYTFIAALILVPSISQAEVLDKFGGCKYPEVFIYLLGFFIVLLVLSKAKKRLMSWLILMASILYLVIFVLLPYLGYLGIIPVFADSARILYYDELGGCPQYGVLGYWTQTWIASLVYIICSLFLVFTSKSRLK